MSNKSFLPFFYNNAFAVGRSTINKQTKKINSPAVINLAYAYVTPGYQGTADAPPDREYH